ncbi:putative disease resistance protein [Cardamine amara subsp. amara]|uniref:Disease resistance protein n=1 Tax=Cardamine amara subsp. amara TaxID=228776 RepID=A0ABD1BHJ2_CARAN
MPPIQLTVSQEKLFERAWNTLKDENVGTLCLYGMGGVGKTTLLTQIKSKVLEAGNAFDLVMFVAVEFGEVESIQEKIINMIGSGFSYILWRCLTKMDMASAIYEVLNTKRFVLLFDDLPKKVDLEEIGVPLPSKQNGSKVVFTTRSREPCGSNWVSTEVEVTCLSPEEAYDLFQKTLKETTLRSHPDIPNLTRVVAMLCRGFPLALSLISETMACKRMVSEWHHAIQVLVSSTVEFSGTEDEILPILKFAYDSLNGENMKSGFLYCALFPKNFHIRKEHLVDCWIGEGIIATEDRDIAVIQGYEMICDLVTMQLLMEDEVGECVKMHDMVREMALGITSDLISGGTRNTLSWSALREYMRCQRSMIGGWLERCQ